MNALAPAAIQSLEGLSDEIQRHDVLCENYERAVRHGYALVSLVVVDAYKQGMQAAEISKVLNMPSSTISRQLGYGLLVLRWQAKGLAADEMPTEGRCRAYLTEAREQVSRTAQIPVNKISSRPKLMASAIALAADLMNSSTIEGEVYASGNELQQPAKHEKTKQAEAAARGARLYKRAKGLGDVLWSIHETDGIVSVLDGCEPSSMPDRDGATLLFRQLRRLHKITGSMLTEAAAHLPQEITGERIGGRL